MSPTRRLLSLLARCGALSVLGITVTAHAAESSCGDAHQLVLVVTVDWNADQGTLQTFSRSGSTWRQHTKPQPVNIGRAGSAWGVGLQPASLPGPLKKEGDGRSPAGIFRIGEAFGYADSFATGLSYHAMTQSNYCVDVSGSPFYNRIVDSTVVGDAAIAGSTEPMRRDLHVNGDQRYKTGFVIEHNSKGTPQAGSCIFAHLWKQPGEPTSGCTAMNESAMRDLLGWLRADQHPIFVLLPQVEYEQLRQEWQLP